MSGTIREMPAEERPRERFLRVGPEALRSAELIAILLRTGCRGASAIEVADELVHHFGALRDLSRASWQELCRFRGVGRDKAVMLKSAFTLAQRLSAERQLETPVLDHPDAVAAWVREEFAGFEVEHFKVLMVNTRRRLIREETIAKGTIDSLLIHPREVFRAAIQANASGIVLAHNHPSGDPAPSEADIKVTRDLIRAGQLLKIDVVDHIIIGRRSEERSRDFVSLRELGYFFS